MDLRIRPLAAIDLPEAHRVMCLAFGTQYGLRDPMTFLGDGSYVTPRWRTPGRIAYAATDGGRLVGSAFAMGWGSLVTVGPVSVDPEYWSRGVARALMAPLVRRLGRRRRVLAGLFTRPDSPKHVRLYESFGFRPQQLVALMTTASVAGEGATLLSALPKRAQPAVLADCRRLAGSLYPGVDPTAEIRAAVAQGIGDAVLLAGGGRLDGFALVQAGPGSECGSGRLLVKFAAVAGGRGRRDRLAALLQSCRAAAAAVGAGTVIAGVNTARIDAYETLKAAGFRTVAHGVAMTRGPNDRYNGPEACLLDDWR